MMERRKKFSSWLIPLILLFGALFIAAGAALIPFYEIVSLGFLGLGTCLFNLLPFYAAPPSDFRKPLASFAFVTGLVFLIFTVITFFSWYGSLVLLGITLPYFLFPFAGFPVAVRAPDKKTYDDLFFQTSFRLFVASAVLSTPLALVTSVIFASGHSPFFIAYGSCFAASLFSVMWFLGFVLSRRRNLSRGRSLLYDIAHL